MSFIRSGTHRCAKRPILPANIYKAKSSLVFLGKTIYLVPVLLACLLFQENLLGQTTSVLTFDNLPSGLTNGYGGLSWTNFALLNGTSHNPSGYFFGMVSPDYVIYNVLGSPAEITGKTGPFDLVSGYLTGAWRDGLQIEVQGFVGQTLTHDSTYTIDSTGPSFIVFNYLNVDWVKFIPTGGTMHGYNGNGKEFVVDNLTVRAGQLPANSNLAIQLTGTNTALVSWVDPLGQFTLYEEPELNANSWKAVTNSPVIVNGTNFLSVPLKSGQQYYRLQP